MFVWTGKQGVLFSGQEWSGNEVCSPCYFGQRDAALNGATDAELPRAVQTQNFLRECIKQEDICKCVSRGRVGDSRDEAVKDDESDEIPETYCSGTIRVEKVLINIVGHSIRHYSA
jgi:hypothetical protein